MESSLKNLINYLQDNVIDLNDDNEISETLVKYIENDKKYCEKIKNIINSHKDDDWEGSEFVDEFNDDFGIELPNYDVLDAMETNEIPNEFAINIVSPDECFKTLNVILKDNNGALEIEDKTPGSQVNIKNNQDNDTRLADYYYDLGVKTGQKMYFEMAKRLKDQANMQALNDLLKRAENTPDDEDGEDIDTSDIDEDNKFVMEVITKDYICNGEGYWDKDDWDDLVKDGNILCYIYDADEDPIPDFSPDWLYKILGKYENIPGGYCLEDMESTFIVSKETYDALAKDPHCDSADDYTECGYNYNEDDEDEYGEDDEDYNNYNDNEIKEKLSNTILNSDFKVKACGRFAPKGGKNKLDLIPDLYKELYGEEIYDKKDIHEILAESPKMEQVRKDIKYDVDFENGYIDHRGTTKDGIDYLAILIHGDWEEPVAIFVYWDGKKYRGYVPTRGNAINTINRSAFGNDEDADNEYCTKYLGLKDYYGCDGCAFGLPINWDACKEEFETRLVAK